MSYISSTGGHRGSGPFEFKALAAETASSTHHVTTPDQPGSLLVTVKVTTVTGTLPTLAVVVESSADGSTWFTVGTVGANGYSVGSVATAPSNITAPVTVSALFPAAEHIRTRSVVGGTTPSFTYSAEGVVA